MTPPGTCIWIEGRPGAGVSTVAGEIASKLGEDCELLDESVERIIGPVGNDLASARRLFELCSLLSAHHVTIIVPAPTFERDVQDKIIQALDVVHVFVDTPEQVCWQRGREQNVKYEPPVVFDVRVLTHDRSPEASGAQVLSYLAKPGR